MTPACRAVARLVQGYLDGELNPSQLIEVESHMQACATCRERVFLDRAIRADLRSHVQSAKPSDSFRARAAASVVAQRWSPAARVSSSSVPTFGGFLVAAAAAAAAIVGIRNPIKTESKASVTPMPAATASVGLDQMIDQFIDWHARPLPPEITNPKDLPGFEPYVGVPVHPSPALAVFGARLLGGRILPVPEQRVTAMLQYTIDGGHRVSVYVFDPRRIATNPSRLHTKVIGSDAVYTGQVRGWSIAAAERRGVGYAIASDLDDEANAELALAAAPAQ